ncbi:MAG: hypothetical protein NTAFB01_11450 [Nitrospira sp.]
MEKLSAKQFKDKLTPYDKERYEVEGHLSLGDVVKRGELPKIYGCIFHDLDLVDTDNNVENETEKGKPFTCLASLCNFLSRMLAARDCSNSNTDSNLTFPRFHRHLYKEEFDESGGRYEH